MTCFGVKSNVSYANNEVTLLVSIPRHRDYCPAHQNRIMTKIQLKSETKRDPELQASGNMAVTKKKTANTWQDTFDFAPKPIGIFFDPSIFFRKQSGMN